MGASSVTGVGLGDSNGKFKPELHCGGCACGGQATEEAVPPKKVACCSTTSYNCRNLSHKSCGSVSVKACS